MSIRGPESFDTTFYESYGCHPRFIFGILKLIDEYLKRDPSLNLAEVQELQDLATQLVEEEIERLALTLCDCAKMNVLSEFDLRFSLASLRFLPGQIKYLEKFLSLDPHHLSYQRRYQAVSYLITAFEASQINGSPETRQSLEEAKVIYQKSPIVQLKEIIEGAPDHRFGDILRVSPTVVTGIKNLLAKRNKR